MKKSIKTGFSFGLTSGIITTLGLMVGLYSGTGSRLVVIGGILIIAIADAFSDSLGIHISEESTKHTSREIWESTFATFLAKFAFAGIFIIPLLLLPLNSAVIASVVLGLGLIGAFSFYIAKWRKVDGWEVVAEHLLISLAVILATYFIGAWVRMVFG